jgi:DNA-directed RNA polymerase specialized sigma24 family protein
LRVAGNFGGPSGVLHVVRSGFVVVPGTGCDGSAGELAGVAARGAALSRTAYLLTGGHDQAQDLLQSALAKVILRWDRIRTGDPEAYLRRVMYNERTSRWRARSAR